MFNDTSFTYKFSTPNDHAFVSVKAQTGCAQCGYARGQHPTKRMLKAIDLQIERIYYKVGNGVQIKITDINKVFDAGRAAAAAGQDIEAALVAAIAALRQN